MDKIDRPDAAKPPKTYTTAVRKRTWLSDRSFELELSRPIGFSFVPGQRIRFSGRSNDKDYSLISTPQDPFLRLCIRRVEGGDFSPRLARADIDTPFEFTGPYGYFALRKTTRPIVFAATGTGIAPFVSMVRSGLKSFTLLHGVQSHKDLYYASLFKKTAKAYVPCLSGDDNFRDCFSGRVTDYLNRHLPVMPYEFYLCGRSEMIRDALWIIDDRFPDSFAYTEIYY